MGPSLGFSAGRVFCDNESVVAVLKSGTLRDKS